MSDLDRMFDAMDRMSLLAQLRDKVAEAADVCQRRCGNCDHWMKSSLCPKEYNHRGYTRGPSCGDPACSKYTLSPLSAAVQRIKASQAVAFAVEHKLPVPNHLISNNEPDAEVRQ